mgnify:FL=1
MPMSATRGLAAVGRPGRNDVASLLSECVSSDDGGTSASTDLLSMAGVLAVRLADVADADMVKLGAEVGLLPGDTLPTGAAFELARIGMGMMAFARISRAAATLGFLVKHSSPVILNKMLSSTGTISGNVTR